MARKKVLTGEVLDRGVPPPAHADWAPAFLAALANSANVSYACKAARISRNVVYQAREDYPAFAAQWDAALDEAVDQLQAAAWAKALGGDTIMTIFLLKCHRPEVFRDRQQVDLVQRIDVSKLSEDQLLHLAEFGELPPVRRT